MRASGSTVTTHSARRSLWIRMGIPSIAVTPLVRAKGAEVGVRTVALSHLQSTLSLWTLGLDSELVYNGDAGATEPGPASGRYGVEFANYYAPKRGWCSMATWPGRMRASPSSMKPASTCPRLWPWSFQAARASTTSIGCLAAFACDTSDRVRSSRTTP